MSDNSYTSGGESPLYGATARLARVLKKTMPKNIDARDRILNDVYLSHQFAGSLKHEEFIRHIAYNMRKQLMNNYHVNNKQMSLYDDTDTRNHIANCFLDAVAEVSADLDYDVLKRVILDDVINFNKTVTDDKGNVFEQAFSFEDEEGNPIDPCPFAKDGKYKIEESNLNALLSYITNAFYTIRIAGSREGTFAIWNIHGYTEDPKAIRQCIKNLLKSYDIQKSDDWIKNNVYKSLNVSSEPVPYDNRLLLPVQNGIIHIFNSALDGTDGTELPPLQTVANYGDFELAAYSRDIVITNCLQATFDPNAHHDKTNEILHGWSNDNPLLYDAILEGMGWAITANKWIKGVLFLAGEGHCGKSAVLDALRALVGEGQYSSVAPKQMDDPSSFHTFPLISSRTNIADEVPSGELSIDLQNTLKNMSGSNGAIPFNEKNKESYQAIPRACMIFATNVVPYMSDITCRRRTCVIPFLRKFSSNGKVNISAVFHTQKARNFLLLECVKGIVRLCKKPSERFSDTFTQSPELTASMKKFETESSSTALWCEYYRAEHEGADGTNSDCDFFIWNKVNKGDTKEQTDNIRRGIQKKIIRNLFNESYLPYCKEIKRKPDNEEFFKKGVISYWQSRGRSLSVKKCNYYVPNSLIDRRLQAYFFIDPSSPENHPITPVSAR